MRAAVRVLVVALILSLGLAGPAHAAAPVLNGTVLDFDTWLPVPGAEVTLQPGGLRAVADEQGAYAFPDVSPGEYRVTVALDGRCGLLDKQPFELDGQGLTLDLYLWSYCDDVTD